MSANQNQNQDQTAVIHWRTELNNILQKNKPLGQLTWAESAAHGHQGPWIAVAMINGVEYGRGEGDSKDAAKDAAAHEEFLILAHLAFDDRVMLASSTQLVTKN
ncbi:uncharacterized protein C8Q71DRAFT_862817 [Rhodofomes roseus]|uniref:DRBM domain-containing protein n=1 Tax=Rhodofomes roseus TaxID=34475 RepID=A0ABQ8K0L8_9APHY|nr:uncharacterized protein C8Q71DRAFT_862817 [Rhodofomes roseus]KAH9829960.1 hypothetical protein C8Q71DRAFT_862817 [Rhodofomes roseus]